MALKSARVSRSVGEAQASIHENPFASKVVGKVSVGIKLMTAPAKQKAKGGVALYEEGVAAGMSFDQIEKDLKTLPGCPQYPLRPANSPYFRVVQTDFSNPGAAETIMRLYGEQRPGDKEPRLYRFPILFPSNEIDDIYPEGFEHWSKSQLEHWSEPDPSTGDLMCMTRGEIDGNNKRKQFGGRPVEVVEECHPNTCALFGEGKCVHTGTLYFYIPGLPGVGVISMKMQSLYAAMGIADSIELVQRGLGTAMGAHNGEPIFWVSKRHRNISRIDWTTGKPTRTDQWIVQLSADNLDMGAVLGMAQPDKAAMLPSPVSEAVAALSAPDVIEQEPEQESDTESAAETERSAEDVAKVKALRKDLSEIMHVLQWTGDEIAAYILENGFSLEDASSTEALPQIISLLSQEVDELNAREEG